MNNDSISREWLEDAFDNLCCHNCKICRNFRIEDSFYKCALIDNAPTVEQSYQEPKDYIKNKLDYSRPQGEWIEKVERRGCFAGDKTVYSYTCPFCGAKEFKKYPFCHCGADMRGGRE